jgi:hypothetical protein
MKSAKPGGSTSGAELQNVSPQGIWILVDDREHYLPFDRFPWFRNATVSQLAEIERPRPEHLRWPLLDVTLASIEDPERYSLVLAGGRPGRAGSPYQTHPTVRGWTGRARDTPRSNGAEPDCGEGCLLSLPPYLLI